jgi:hypothetical protein
MNRRIAATLGVVLAIAFLAVSANAAEPPKTNAPKPAGTPVPSAATTKPASAPTAAPAMQAKPAAATSTPAAHAKPAAHTKLASTMPATPTESSYTGEVVDITCSLSHAGGNAAARSAPCTTNYLESGLPAGLLISNRFYVALMKDQTPAGKTLAPYVGKQVTVKGIAHEVHGVHFMEILSVAPAAATHS